MPTDLTRRRLLQATGATIAAGYVTSQADAAYAATAPTNAPPTITTLDTADLIAGASVVQTISATGFPSGFAVQGLPAGLVVDRTTGVITGAPTSPGTYTATLSVANAVGTATKDLILTVH